MRTGINHEEWRDEIYLQLCKQTNFHPSMYVGRDSWRNEAVVGGGVVCIAIVGVGDDDDDDDDDDNDDDYGWWWWADYWK